MGDVRTTVSLSQELYDGLRSSYRDLGFSRMGDLINEALREYLHKQRILAMNRSMERAAASAEYRALLREVSEDFASVDAEGLPPDY